MADPVAIVEKIVRIGLVIKGAVDTARNNEEECRNIGKSVLRFSAILSQLQETGFMNNNLAMSGALEDLEETLEHALKLVMECQERHIVRRFLGAGGLSRQLRRVKDDILNKVMLVIFAINAQQTIVLLTIQAGGHPPLRLQQDTGATDISPNSYSIDDARSELNGEENNAQAGSEAPSALLVALRKFSYSELEAAINGGNIIGEGSSCKVYKGVLNNGTVVAIKKFKCEGGFKYGRTYDERLFSQIQHKNIVEVLGYGHHEVGSSVMRLLKRKCGRVKEREFIYVEEYMPNGSLAKIIKEHESQLDWSSIFRIIEGLAQGLHYLHEQRIVHLDVNRHNVLLDSDMNPRITDFGISLLLGDEDDEIENPNGVVGTVGYIDPEYILNGIVTTKNDVYGFGMILLETVRGLHTSIPLNREHPFDQWAWEAREAGRMEEVFDPSSFDGSQLMEIKRCVEIGLLCVQFYRADRPTMADVLEMLNGNEELPTPLNPYNMTRYEEGHSSSSAWSDGSISPR